MDCKCTLTVEGETYARMIAYALKFGGSVVKVVEEAAKTQDCKNLMFDTVVFNPDKFSDVPSTSACWRCPIGVQDDMNAKAYEKMMYLLFDVWVGNGKSDRTLTISKTGENEVTICLSGPSVSDEWGEYE